ncbi:MAG TPA: branched-chain amino acid aminotransferase, partial [Sphingomicrobium sp.]
RDRGIEVVERPIWPEEMEGFEQAFLTGTAAEVTAVQSIGPYKFGSVDMAHQLDKAYEDLVYERIPND